jgi:hypothetical protein
LPESVIHPATRILRHAARHDFRSGLPQVLGSSAYSIDEVGEWSLNDKPGYRRQFRIIGAAMVIRVARPHPVDVDVIVAGTGWPRGSKNYRFSRRYGYVPYRARLISKSLMDLSVLIDVRRGKVASVEVGPSGSVDHVVPLHGSCPEKPPPPGYD